MQVPTTGKALRIDLSNLKITRKPIAEEFLYDRDILLLSGDSGIGKTQITMQIIFDLLASPALFGNIKIYQRPSIFYLQLEGDYEETIERLRRMEEVSGLTIEDENLCVWEKKDLEAADVKSVDSMIHEIKNNTQFKPTVFIVDPIYKLTGLDISKADGARTVIGFSDRLQLEFDCSNILIHHNGKDSFVYTKEGRFSKDDAYYGHSFIKNHVRTSYAITQGDKEKQDSPMFTRKKGRGSDTLPKIELHYDHETGLCSFKDDGLSPITKFSRAIMKMRASGQTQTDFNKFGQLSTIPTATLRRLKKDSIFNDNFDCSLAGKNKEIWTLKQALSS